MTLRQRVDHIIRTTLDKHDWNIHRTAAELNCSVRMIRYTVRRFERQALAECSTDEQRKFIKENLR